jgi:PAS domain S-box-containing protein
MSAAIIKKVKAKWMSNKTDMKKITSDLKAAIAYADNIINSIPDILYIVDIDGFILRTNKVFKKVTGYSGTDMVGMNIYKLLSEEDVERARDALKRAWAGETITIELTLITKQKEKIPYSWTMNILKGEAGGSIGVIGAGRDIREIKLLIEGLEKAKAKVEEYSRTLEKKVAERTRELEASTKEIKEFRDVLLSILEDTDEAKRELEVKSEELERSNKELDDFTYIVSHDLKEPLRSIDAFSKFIEDDYKDRLGEEGRNYLGRIRANAGRMQALIEDLLEISRIERRRNPFEEVQVEELIDEAKLRLEYAIRQKNAEIIIRDKLPKVFCDRVRLAEVFVNLISNAIKFNDKTQPRVEIGCSQKGNFYEFYVKDNGPGIEKQYFDKIFEIFQRLGRREEREGTGAGLTIAKKIVEMHKGKIWVESKIGESTTFNFTIPKERGIILGKKKLGEILIGKNMLTEAELKEALEEQGGDVLK